MGKMTKKEMPMWAKGGHAKPVTRREFLAAGIIPFAASAMLPSIFSLIPSHAQAEAMACPAMVGGLPAMLTINCSGGGGLAANYLPRLASGALLSSYDRLAFPTALNEGMMQSQFGVASFAPGCGFITGLNAKASVAALSNASFVAMCVQSTDDTQENKFDITGMAYRAGLNGTTLPNLATTGRSTGTGVGQSASTVSPPLPLFASSFQSLANSISYTAALSNNLGKTTAQGEKLRNSLTRLVSNLTTSQTRKLASMPQAAQLKSVIDCAAGKNVDLITNSAAYLDSIDPLKDTGLGSQIGTLFGSGNDQRVFSALIYNALKGNSGSASIELGGFDYHGQTRAATDLKDAELGETVGKALQVAHLMGRKLFIYVTSDGATGSNPGSNDWSADRGTGGIAYLITYDPDGRRGSTSSQINAFTQGQVADESHPIGTSPERAGQAAFANYCRFASANAWRATYGRGVPAGNGLDDAQLASVVKVI